MPGDTPQPKPQAPREPKFDESGRIESRLPAQPSPERAENPAAQDESAREVSVRDLTSAERLLQAQEASQLTDSVEDAFRNIERKLQIPPTGPDRGRFEDEKQQVLLAAGQCASQLLAWHHAHPDANIRLSGQMQGNTRFENALAPDLPPDARLQLLNEFANAFEITGGDQDAFREILKNYFHALMPIFRDTDLIGQRETKARLPVAVRTVYTQLESNPAHARNLLDSRILIEQFPEGSMREAVRQYRELRAGAGGSTQASGSAEAPATGASAPTAGSPETASSRSRNGREPISWDDIMQILIIMSSTGTPAEKWAAWNEYRQGKEPTRTPPSTPATPPEIQRAVTSRYFEGPATLNIEDTLGSNEVIVNSAQAFNVKLPKAGKVLDIQETSESKIVKIKAPINEGSYLIINYIFPRETALTTNTVKNANLSEDTAIALDVRSVSLSMQQGDDIPRQSQDRMTTLAPSKIRQIFSLPSATAPTTVTPEAGPAVAPAQQPTTAPGQTAGPATGPAPQPSGGPVAPQPGAENAPPRQILPDALKVEGRVAYNFLQEEIHALPLRIRNDVNREFQETVGVSWNGLQRESTQERFDTFKRLATNFANKLYAFRRLYQLVEWSSGRSGTEKNDVQNLKRLIEGRTTEGGQARENIVERVQELERTVQTRLTGNDSIIPPPPDTRPTFIVQRPVSTPVVPVTPTSNPSVAAASATQAPAPALPTIPPS